MQWSEFRRTVLVLSVRCSFSRSIRPASRSAGGFINMLPSSAHPRVIRLSSAAPHISPSFFFLPGLFLLLPSLCPACPSNHPLSAQLSCRRRKRRACWDVRRTLTSLDWCFLSVPLAVRRSDTSGSNRTTSARGRLRCRRAELGPPLRGLRLRGGDRSRRSGWCSKSLQRRLCSIFSSIQGRGKLVNVKLIKLTTATPSDQFSLMSSS